MSYCLFYNQSTGAGAVGEIIGNNSFKTTQTVNPGGFARDWSNVVPMGYGIFFYNRSTGAAAIGSISDGEFSTDYVFPGGSFAHGWSHIVELGHDLALFYRASTGEGSLVRQLSSSPSSANTSKAYPPGSFARNWSHIVSGGFLSTLFYNSATGAGAITELFDNDPQPWSFGGVNDLRTVRVYPDNSFAPGWDLVDFVNGRGIFFYNPKTGGGALGSIDSKEFTTTHVYRDGAFKTGWTEIMGGGSLPLFYDRNSGEGALGFDPSVEVFPEGAFATGWTHVVPQSQPPVIK